MVDNANGVPEGIHLKGVWIAPEQEPVTYANQFTCQIHQDTFLVGMGQVTPPLLLGTAEERLEQARSLSFLPIRTLGRYSMSREDLRQFIGVLTQIAETYDMQLSAEGESE